MKAPRKVVILVVVVAASLVTAIIAAAALLNWQMRQQALAATEQQATRFVAGAEIALNRSVLGIDVALAGMGELFSAQTAAGDAMVVALQPDASRALQRLVGQSLLIRAVVLMRPDGNMLAGSSGPGSGLPQALQQTFLENVASAVSPGLMVSAPSLSLVSPQKVLYFARRLSLPDQTVVLAVAEVQISNLTSILTQGATIEGLEVTLERDSGALLASAPPREDLSGTQLMPVLSERTSDGQPIHMSARLSGAPAIVAVRPTLQRNLLVVAGIPLHAALTQWRRDRDVVYGGAFVFALLVVTIAAFTLLLALRQIRSRVEILRSKAAMDHALDAMADGFVLLDARSRVLAWNSRFTDIFPWLASSMTPFVSFDTLLKETARLQQSDALGWDHMTVAGAASARALLQPQGQGNFEHEAILPGGRIVHAIRRSTNDGGQVCVYSDVTERKQQTYDLMEGRAQLQAMLDALPDLLMEVDLDGYCRDFHAPRARRYAAPLESLAGRKLSETMPVKSVDEIMNAVREAHVMGYSEGRQFEQVGTKQPGWFELSVSRKSIGATDEPRFVVILRDISASKTAAREIEKLAFYDNLTGLPNRRLLQERLTLAMASTRRPSAYHAMLFLDLDQFKTLNDALGHHTGDHLLQQVAGRLESQSRPGDTVARLGGDEFVLLLTDLGEDAAQAGWRAAAIGQAILALLSHPYQLSSQTYRCTCSIGAALFSGTEQSLEELLKQADLAMYHAKAKGGNAVSFFETEMQVAIAARASLESALHTALATDQFTLYFQSQVTPQGRVAGVEALIRWHHPTQGLMLPGSFIQIAEETGLILPIGLWVLESACRLLAQWRALPDRQDLPVAVNVSARQFRDDDFVAQVRTILQRTGADPSRLKLELTESLLQDKVDDTVSKMNALKALGIRFAMDDFGMGFSSLSYMTQLPLDQLKIDKYFVQRIGQEPKVELIIKSIIAMADNLGLELVAEGVETAAQQTYLQQQGCALCQGYLFGKPMTLEALEQHIDQQNAMGIVGTSLA